MNNGNEWLDKAQQDAVNKEIKDCFERCQRVIQGDPDNWSTVRSWMVDAINKTTIHEMGDLQEVSYSFDDTKCLDPVRESLIASIEAEVLSRLPEADGNIDIILTDKDGKFHKYLLFSVSEVRMKTCRNCWDVWKVASSSGWPRMITCKTKRLCDNSCDDRVLPNEVRSFNYSVPIVK